MRRPKLIGAVVVIMTLVLPRVALVEQRLRSEGLVK